MLLFFAYKGVTLPFQNAPAAPCFTPRIDATQILSCLHNKLAWLRPCFCLKRFHFATLKYMYVYMIQH
jgi:hypothetical protein